MQVYDVEVGTIIDVAPAEAAAGLVRYARSLGPGAAACGELERQALNLSPEEPVTASSESAAPTRYATQGCHAAWSAAGISSRAQSEDQAGGGHG